MKKVTLAIAVAALAVFSFSSCKKKDDNNGGGATGRTAQLIGTWKQTYSGSDDNGNGTWDATEKAATPATGAPTLTFASNGTGSASANLLGVPLTGTLAWNFFNNENGVKITVTIPNLGTDTYYYKILSFSNTEIIVADTTVTPIDFEQYTKQ